MDHDKDRRRLVEQTRRYLEAGGRARLVMLAVLSVTLAAGFLASVAMLRAGVHRMPVRYPLAVAVSYATFLATLRSWLRQQVIAKDLGDDPEGLLLPGVAAFGAAALAAKVADPEQDGARPKSPTDGGVGDFSGLGDLADVGGEGCGALAVLVLIAGLCTLIVSLYLVATSPMLLAELLVDGALLGAMSRAVSPGRTPHWSRALARRTWFPALVTAIVFGLVGWGIERVAPGAHTLAEAWAIDKAR